MEMDKSILLQKQVRDNSSDLQSEFIDLKNWEEEMKRKDSELIYAAGDQVLPPIRSRKKNAAKKAEPKAAEEINKNTKRIKSSDYSSWDNFDADKACEELDEKAEHETSDEELSKEELERNHKQALRHKDQGNVFVKQQQWSQAVESYNEAIKIFPYDAVFYANRALCHLKMDNLHSAEADCTAAIQLDELYVKAYHRRATARKELKQYKEAMADLEKVLKLDPGNKEAGKILAQVKDKVEKPKPVVVPQEDPDDNTSMEKKIGEKLFGGGIKKADDPVKEASVVNKIGEKVFRDPIEKPKDISVEKKNGEKLFEGEIKKPEAKERKSVSQKQSPCWALGEGEDVAVVQPIVKPPHQRSKKPLRRIEVKETEDGKVVERVEPLVREIIPETESKRSAVEPASPRIVEVPPVPRTTVQFFMHWKKNKDPEFRFNYLEQMPDDAIHKIFKDSMEPDTFSEILTILSTEFIKRKKPLYRYLVDLAQVKRFGALIMFMSTADKKALNAIFESCETLEAKSKEDLASLRSKYEI